MRYIEERPFVTVLGGPFSMVGVKGDRERKTEAATVSEVLYWLLDGWQPSQGQTLTMQELRQLNRVIDILKVDEPQENGCYRFETADFELLKKVVLWVAPLCPAARNAPLIEDILLAATETAPTATPAESEPVELLPSTLSELAEIVPSTF